MEQHACNFELILLSALEACGKCGWPAEDHPQWAHRKPEPEPQIKDAALFNRESGQWADGAPPAESTAPRISDQLRSIAGRMHADALALEAAADAMDRE